MEVPRSNAVQTDQPVEFFANAESAYPNVPHSMQKSSQSLYIDTPNEYFDPIQGQYNLDTEFQFLESLENHGFDGAVLTEQHNGPIGGTPNVLVAASYLAARTTRLKIVAAGPLLNAYQSPIRLAEEIALVDVLSRGRLVVGLPMGLGQQYHSLGINPATARNRHAEGVDLLFKALSEPGPFSWRGEHFNQNYVNVWPRPAHPIEFIMPSGGSIETLGLAAKRRVAYQTVLTERAAQVATLNKFRDLCREEGYEPDPRQSTIVVEVHVAETDEIARREAEPMLQWNYQNWFRGNVTDSFPPGYTSSRSMRAILGAGYALDTDKMTIDDIIDNNQAIVGSPETVIAGLKQTIAETGAGRVILTFSTGIKPRWLLQKTVAIFAEQVLPAFRPQGVPLSESEATYGFRTTLEYAAKRRKDAPPPTIVKDGYLQDVHKLATPGVDARIREWKNGDEEVIA